MYKRLGNRSTLPGSTRQPISIITSIIQAINSYKFTVVSLIAIYFMLRSRGAPSVMEDIQVYHDYYFPNSNLNVTEAFSIFGSVASGNRPKIPSKNTKDMYTIETRLSYSFPYQHNEAVENNIWQLWKFKSDDRRFPRECFQHIERWRFVNDNYNHNLISIAEAKEQVYDYFINDVPEVVEALELLPDDRLKYEFLKYLVIYINGGVYADVDTICAKPLKYWYDSNIVPGKLFLGVAIDYNDENWELLYNRRMIMSNKIFKAKSHHPFLAKLIARLVYMAFNQYQQITQIDWNKSFQNLDSNGEPLIQFTGESILTDTLFDYLNNLDSPIVYRVARTEKDVLPQEIIGPETTERFSYKLFTMAKGPTQVDDVVILPEVTFRGSPEISHDVKGVEHEYDDNNQRKGYLSFYCARPLNLISWQSIEEGIVE